MMPRLVLKPRRIFHQGDRVAVLAMVLTALATGPGAVAAPPISATDSLKARTQEEQGRREKEKLFVGQTSQQVAQYKARAADLRKSGANPAFLKVLQDAAAYFQSQVAAVEGKSPAPAVALTETTVRVKKAP